jgi:hypothetical protein
MPAPSTSANAVVPLNEVSASSSPPGIGENFAHHHERAALITHTGDSSHCCALLSSVFLWAVFGALFYGYMQSDWGWQFVSENFGGEHSNLHTSCNLQPEY